MLAVRDAVERTLGRILRRRGGIPGGIYNPASPYHRVRCRACDRPGVTREVTAEASDWFTPNGIAGIVLCPACCSPN